MPSRTDLRSRIDRELASKWALFVAERDGGILGMLAIKPAEAVLDQIFVDINAQSTGIGTALLGAAKIEMPEGFTLRMAASNQRAERFYIRSGLRIVDEGIHPTSGTAVRYLRWN